MSALSSKAQEEKLERKKEEKKVKDGLREYVQVHMFPWIKFGFDRDINNKVVRSAVHHGFVVIPPHLKPAETFFEWVETSEVVNQLLASIRNKVQQKTKVRYCGKRLAAVIDGCFALV